MYILLFTCLNVCDVRIELVPDMSTHHISHISLMFMTFLHTCIATAKSFIAGGEILQKALVSDEYRDKFDVLDIRHIKIPQYSA